ncbi:hypothetical protein KP509_05G004100 [Ceratopteris richardii]|uniref:BZIP domain-containing protein n=1 Tax=Ceratopteris richardii TaxID=49495 RepID=A0A8T2URX5_CERRI|nr:hypothetical protein KP509_05G004100 [Ceratopteris richardii]
MAKLVEGDSKGFQRGTTDITSRLPPRFPSAPGRSLLPPDVSTTIYDSQSFENLSRDQWQYKYASPWNAVGNDRPVWLDDLWEDSEGTNKRSHRRSASDSFAFLESAGSLHPFNSIAEEPSHKSSSILQKGPENIDMINGSSFTDLLDRIKYLQDHSNSPVSEIAQPAISGCEISRLIDKRGISAKAGSTLAPNSKGSSGQFLSPLEEKRSEVIEHSSHDNPNNDANGDPKKAKRQSAQRSRVRKLQYIAELERIVNLLQVASLSPQLLFFQRQRAYLTVDNNTLKQKITLCMREKNITDSQNEALMSERERLRRLYGMQVVHDLQSQKQPAQRIHRHSSLPTDFGTQLHQYREHNAHAEQAEPPSSSPDVLPSVIEDLAGVSLDTQGERG